MAAFMEQLSHRCPACAAPGLVEFSEPGGVVLCPRCGYFWQALRGPFKETGLTRPERIELIREVIKETGLEDGIDFLDLVFRIERLEESGADAEEVKQEMIKLLNGSQ
jgi:uncharacterized Zn finger protein (UPF0148 family)